MGSTIPDGRRPAACSRRRPPLAWWLGSPLVLLGACWLAGLRLNLTGSLPVGLYVASRAAPVRGALVLACLPASVAAFAKERGYVPRGGACPGGVVPVGKPVLAIPGDTVTVTPTGLLVNGAPVSNSRPLAADRKGRPLPQLALGRYDVGPGELWVVSSYSRLSFDSRYFGAVEAAQVRVSVRRLWTAGPDR
jgi:conjugative transfer signal peptidase TraF